jgi:hypothetical protein
MEKRDSGKRTNAPNDSHQAAWPEEVRRFTGGISRKPSKIHSTMTVNTKGCRPVGSLKPMDPKCRNNPPVGSQHPIVSIPAIMKR